MKEIKIRAPFYGAGSPKQFDWVKDGYHIYGIGVKIDDVKNHELLEIKVEGEWWLVESAKIKEFVNKYRSVYKVRNSDVRLAVFSKSLLDNLLIKPGKA